MPRNLVHTRISDSMAMGHQDRDVITGRGDKVIQQHAAAC